MSASNTLYGALAYNQIKVDEDHAKVIFTHNMIEPRDGRQDISTCLRSFEPYLLVNRNTEKPVLHVSLNPDPKDRLSDEELSDIASEYMQRMGYGNQPFIVYKHEDIERRHIHIVSLRVDGNGKKINDRFEHRRSMDACRELEQKYGLVPAGQNKREAGLPLKPVRYEGGDVKHQIANVIRPLAHSWHFQSLKEYRTLLTLYNISVEEVKGEVKSPLNPPKGDLIYRGLIYFALDGKGEKIGVPFKSSLFGKAAGIEALEKRIVKSTEIIRDRGLKERSKKVIADALRTCNNRKDFEKALKRQGISALFRTSAEGRIYGATFIDHEQCCVFNGSRLDREFSANVFNGLFSGRGHEPDQSQNGQAIERPDNLFHEWENSDTGVGGLLGLFTPETGSDTADDAEERALTRRMKKKPKRQRRM